MRIPIPDFDKVETGYEALPANTYEALVTKCMPGKSRVKGTSQIEWEFTIQGPTHVGRKLFENTFLSERALFTTKALVVGCGAAYDNTGFNTEDCLGKRVKLTLGQKMNDAMGRIDNVIGKIVPFVG